MSVALYDADFVAAPNTTPYNIQLMKLSTYYKRRKEIVVFLTDISKYYLYNKIIYFQNNLSLDIPSIIGQIDNIEYYGRAFSHQYQYLGDEVEKSEPDVYIYSKYHLKNVSTTDDKNHYFVLQNAMHVQLSFDGKTLNPFLPQEPSTVNFYCIHDYSFLYIDGWREWIKMMMHDKRKYIYLVYPQAINDKTMFEIMSQFNYNAKSRPFYINFPMTEKEYFKYVDTSNIQFTRRCIYYFGDKALDGQDLIEELKTIIRRINYAKAHEKSIMFVYKGYYPYTMTQWFAQSLQDWSIAGAYLRDRYIPYIQYWKKRRTNKTTKQAYEAIIRRDPSFYSLLSQLIYKEDNNDSIGD